MTVENLSTVEAQDAFERFQDEVTKEIQNLEKVFDRALSDLFSIT